MPTLHVHTIVLPLPHPLKAELKKAGITIAAASQHAGYSYTHSLNMLNRSQRMSDAFFQKSAELIANVRESRL